MKAGTPSAPRRARLFISAAAIVSLGGVLVFWQAETAVAQNVGATGAISGSVTADRGEVRALRVQARDTIHRITYTVYTNKGRYRIADLPPSTYEVRVLEPEFDSPVLTVDVRADGSATADVALKAKPAMAAAELVEYDALYPPGPGRDILEQGCLPCHGPSGFHRRAGKTEQGWAAAFDRMDPRDRQAYEAEGRAPGERHPQFYARPMSPEQRAILIEYLATNFPPGQEGRDLKKEPLIRNEDALAQAVWVNYELPPPQDTRAFANGQPRRSTHDVFPSQITPGLIWMAGPGNGSLVAVNTHTLDFATRTKDRRIPDPNDLNVRPHGVVEHDGLVYLTTTGTHDGVDEFNPETGRFTKYHAPQAGGGSHTSRVDSKGNVWFTTIFGHGRVNRLDAATKDVTEYHPLEGEGIGVPHYYGIVVDGQDRVWVTGASAFAVAMYDPKTDRWTKYPTPHANRRIAIDPRGKVWTSNRFPNAITMIDPNTGQATDYKLPLQYGAPYEVWPDLAGNIWATDQEYHALVKFDQTTKTFTYFPYPVPTGHIPKMEIDAQGTLWFSIGRPSQLGGFTEKGNAGVGEADRSTARSR